MAAAFGRTLKSAHYPLVELAKTCMSEKTSTKKRACSTALTITLKWSGDDKDDLADKLRRISNDVRDGSLGVWSKNFGEWKVRWTHKPPGSNAERLSENVRTPSAERASFTLEEVINAALRPFGSGREYGTPIPSDGLFCKLCGAEAIWGQTMRHDTSCLLWKIEMEATMQPNAQSQRASNSKSV